MPPVIAYSYVILDTMPDKFFKLVQLVIAPHIFEKKSWSQTLIQEKL